MKFSEEKYKQLTLLGFRNVSFADTGDIMNNKYEQLIRELAYKKWEDAGCPEGCADQFWAEAEEELGKQPTVFIKTVFDNCMPTDSYAAGIKKHHLLDAIKHIGKLVTCK